MSEDVSPYLVDDVYQLRCKLRCSTCKLPKLPKLPNLPNYSKIKLFNRIAPKNNTCIVCFERIKNDTKINPSQIECKKCCQCGYMVCHDCGVKVDQCPNCRFKYGNPPV